RTLYVQWPGHRTRIGGFYGRETVGIDAGQPVTRILPFELHWALCPGRLEGDAAADTQCRRPLGPELRGARQQEWLHTPFRSHIVCFGLEEHGIRKCTRWTDL